MLANDRQGLLTERAAGQYCVSWVGPGSGSTQTSETQETLTLGGQSNTSDSRGKSFLSYTASEVKNTCRDLTGEQRTTVAILSTSACYITQISA